MKNKRLFLCVISALIFAITSFTSAYYPVIDLGTLGGRESHAYSINNNNQIVGVAGTSAPLRFN